MLISLNCQILVARFSNTGTASSLGWQQCQNPPGWVDILMTHMGFTRNFEKNIKKQMKNKQNNHELMGFLFFGQFPGFETTKDAGKRYVFSPKPPWKTGAPGVACEVLSRFERSGRQGAHVQIPAATDLAGGRR